MYACICRQITEGAVRRCGQSGVTAPDDLIAVLGLDDSGCCGRCREHVHEFVELACQGAAQRAEPRRPLLASAAHSLAV